MTARRSRLLARADRRADRQNWQIEAEATAALARADRKPAGLDNVPGTTIEHWLEIFAGLLGRHVGFARHAMERGSFLLQRCRACRIEIKTQVPDRVLTEAADWQAELGHLIRHGYDSHLCASVEVALIHCDHAQMDQLLFDTENELERVAKRAQAIRDHMLKGPSNG